jgi:hypothetical protein
MRRLHTRFFFGFALLIWAAACSDNNAGVTAAPGEMRAALMDPAPPPGTLDDNIIGLLALLPKGLETAATTRWANVKAKYAAGLSDPAQMAVAKEMLFELSDWVSQKAPTMDDPPNSETRSAAAARAVLYMSMYVYRGPLTPLPAYVPSADNAFGVVTPAAPATIVTPTTHAGIQLEAGSVDENTIIVITQATTLYRDNCQGPLTTRFCQYPQFYSFEEFPHKALLKPAKFNVCHVNSGPDRPLLADHDRFRLAHTKPDNPADYTPGSTVLDQNGENIEVLPLIHQTFSTCVGNAYPIPAIVAGPVGILSRVVQRVQNLITPKNAYAVDLGLGGLSKSMSPFNDVDTLSGPDVDVASVVGSSGLALPGSHVTLTYSVGNIGTAANTPAQAAIVAAAPSADVEFPSVPRQVGSVFLGAIAPRTTTNGQIDVVVPQDLPVGNYDLALVVPSDPTFRDLDVSNNRRSVPIEISEVWHVQEDGGWHAVWTRTPSGGFDGAWESDDFKLHEFFPMTYAREGDSIDMVRTQGNACHYSGTITGGGLSAGGTEVCPGDPRIYNWTATIGVR